jgi:hypothetical protein
MSYPKQLVIAYGTGRCGSKSLAAFLNRQQSVEFTHEMTNLAFWPMMGEYRRAVDQVMDYDAPIVGDISPQWVMYLDRLVYDFPSVKFIWLSRNNLPEVAKSFYAYLQHSNKHELFRGDCHGWYPVQSQEFSVENIYRTLLRYDWVCKMAEQTWGHNRMMKISMNDLNNETAQKAILSWIGAEEPWSLHMPHINKRDWKVKQALKHS